MRNQIIITGNNPVRKLLRSFALFVFTLLFFGSLIGQETTVRQQPNQQKKSAEQLCAEYKGACPKLYCDYISKQGAYEDIVANPPSGTSPEEETKIAQNIGRLKRSADAAFSKYMDCRNRNPEPTEKDKRGGNQGGNNNPPAPDPDPETETKTDSLDQPKEVKDSDGDGVPDNLDKCEHTPMGTKVDARGCPYSNKLLINSPLNNQIFWITDQNERLHVSVDVEVFAPKGDVRSADVQYYGPDGVQADGIAMSKNGGPGKGNIIVTGPRKYTFKVTAQFEEGATIQKSVSFEVKMASKTLQNLQTLHKIQKDAMDMARDKVQEIAAHNAGVNVKTDAIIELDTKEAEELIKSCEKTIEAFDTQRAEMDKELEEKVVTPITAEMDQEMFEMENDFDNWEEELDFWKDMLEMEAELEEEEEWLNDMDDLEDFVELKDENLPIKIQTSQDKDKIVYSDKDGIYLIVNGKGEITKEIDTRSTVIKIADGTIGFFKDMYHGTKQNIIYPGMRLVTGQEYSMKDLIEDLNHELSKETWPLKVNGKYVELSPQNTAFELSVDPVAGLDTVRVIHGPIIAKSPSGQFSDQVLESKTIAVFSEDGMIAKREHLYIEMDQQMKKYEKHFGVHPAFLQHNEAPHAFIDLMPSRDFQVGQPLVVSARASDPENHALSYLWYLNENYVPELQNQRSFEYGDLESGTHKIELVVRDEIGARYKATKRIFVENELGGMIDPMQLLLIAGGVILILVVIIVRLVNKR